MAIYHFHVEYHSYRCEGDKLFFSNCCILYQECKLVNTFIGKHSLILIGTPCNSLSDLFLTVSHFTASTWESKMHFKTFDGVGILSTRQFLDSMTTSNLPIQMAFQTYLQIPQNLYPPNVRYMKNCICRNVSLTSASYTISVMAFVFLFVSRACEK